MRKNPYIYLATWGGFDFINSSALVMIVSICLDLSSLFLRSSESCFSIVRYTLQRKKRTTSFDLDFTYCSISSRCVFSLD